jgi:release factor glutamine methyltransferase
VEGRFDLIVSNPPYIAAEDSPGSPPRCAIDPEIALTPGGDGLDAYRTIAARAGAHLTPGGRLVVEIGHEQGAAVAALFREAGLADVAVHPDINGKDRVVAGCCA